MAKITVQNTEISIVTVNESDYISLTDIAKHKSNEPAAVIGNWMRNRNTIEYLGLWETLYNPNFKLLEFDGFRKQAGLNAFTLSPQNTYPFAPEKHCCVKNSRNTKHLFCFISKYPKLLLRRHIFVKNNRFV